MRKCFKMKERKCLILKTMTKDHEKKNVIPPEFFARPLTFLPKEATC